MRFLATGAEPQSFDKSRPVARPAKPGADMRLCAGDWVEVRSKAEILSTLDENGRLEGLPFMPQMFQYCGQADSGLQAGAQDLRHSERPACQSAAASAAGFI